MSASTFNIADLIESLVDVIPERDAVIVGDTRVTYAQLEERANRLAHALAARGVGAGDHVGMYMYNSAEFVEAMLACFKLRAVPININYRYVEDELSYLCDNADLKALFFQRELAARWAHVRGRLPGITTAVFVDEGSGADVPDGSIEIEAFRGGQSAARDFGPRSNDDLYIIYTGGTTGMPRGVMWRHGDLFYAGLQGGAPGGEACQTPEQLAENAKEDWRAMGMLPVAPLIHGAAQFAVWIALFTGGKAVFVEGKSFDPDTTWRLASREKVTTLLIVGDAMARPLADALEGARGRGEHYDLEALRAIASSGAILSASVKEQLERLLPDAMVLNNFGASETGHQGAAFASGDGRKLTWVMSEGTTVLDEHLREVVPGSGVVGKLARRGRVPLGYYKDPVKTAATFVEVGGVRHVIPGDLATVEEDGTITVFGRGAVCINTGGEKVFPEEIEEVLKGHPAVQDAVVVGVPDKRFGERVAALVQARAGMTPTAVELEAHCRKHVAGYKVPREVHLIAEVVRHPSGKPDYRWAKTRAIEAGDAAAAGPVAG